LKGKNTSREDAKVTSANNYAKPSLIQNLKKQNQFN
jgi:hypothetical protein